MIFGGYKFVGIVNITVTDADGNIVSEKTVHNTETNYMRQAVAQWLAGVSNGIVVPPTVIGAGNGTGTPSPTDTSLWSPIAGTTRTVDSITLTRNYYAQFNINYQITDPTGNYTELGLFDSNGNMWAHVSINEYKDVGQMLSVQWMVYMVADTSNPSAIVTNYTRSAVAQWMTGVPNNLGGPLPYPSQIQLGTGTGTPQVGDTSLWAPDATTLRNCDSVGNSDPYTAFYAVNFQDNSSGSWSEVGLLDSTGNLWAHGTLSSTKSASNYLAVAVSIGVNGDN
jgi:hypothetical protein